MRKRFILVLCSLILSIPFSVFCLYETELPEDIEYHEGGNCACACAYSWLTYLYNIGETFQITYSNVESALGSNPTDEDVAEYLNSCTFNDQHTVLEAETENFMWEQIGCNIINRERPHMETITDVIDFPDIEGHAILAVAVQTEKDPDVSSDDYDVIKVKWFDSMRRFDPAQFYGIGDFSGYNYSFKSPNNKYRAVLCYNAGSGVDEEKPDKYDLFVKSLNAPSQATEICYTLPKKSKVDLNIYDSMGRVVNTLVNKEQKAGIYTVKWKGKDNSGNILPNGIYFCNLKAADFKDTRKIVRLTR